jgi:hypothetical protein
MFLAACGGDGVETGGAGDVRTQDYVDAVAGSMLGNEPQFEPAQADCIGVAIVDLVGVDILTEADISPEELGDAENLSSLDVDLPDDAADRLGAALGDCDVTGAVKERLVDSFTREAGAVAAPDAATCLSDNLDDRAVTDAMARTFVDGQGEQHVNELAVSATVACPSVMTALLLAGMPSDLSPSSRACVSDFVEGNADLVEQSFISDSSNVREQLAEPLAAACPEVAATSGG